MATLFAMKLVDYLAQENITAAEFGRRINRGRSAVLRWVKGERIPDREGMALIFKETAGAVRADDFFDSEAA